MSEARRERAQCRCHPRNLGHRYDDELVCFGCKQSWPRVEACPTPCRMTAVELGALASYGCERPARGASK